MSSQELHRVEVLARVKNRNLKLKDAAALLRLSHRQVKRLWKRYRKGGAKALQHGNVGRASNRAKPVKFRRAVLARVRKKYSGEIGERFGPTLAAEHLAKDDGLQIDAETLRRWMLAEGLWSRERKCKRSLVVAAAAAASAGNGENTLATWCRWMGVSMHGLRSGDHADV